MHTSTRLTNSDFYFSKVAEGQTCPISFDDFCPKYHALDRIGVVSPTIEDGVLNTGRAILALTTAFYDAKRAEGGDFFDYPQHFAIVGADSIDTLAQQGVDENSLWGAWIWLDVWPNNKWLTAKPTATSMLKIVFDYQINRLFWPANLWPADDEAPLPEYAYRMLKTRLTSVYLHGEDEGDWQGFAVSGSPGLEQLYVECVERLPKQATKDARYGECGESVTERLRLLSVDEFIERHLSVYT